MSKPQKTPLVDLLRQIPPNHRTEWPIQGGHSLCPIGRLAQEAADKIEELEEELEEARNDSRFLSALSAAGVDNWDGYDYAQEIMESWD